MNDGTAARDYHRLTVHPRRRAHDRRLVRDFEPMDPRRRPLQGKVYPGLELMSLPRQVATPDRYGALDPMLLGRLLFLSAGVVRVLDSPALGEMWFRAAGSAGNLAPLELYVLTGELPGLAAGAYHYQPREHGLVRLAALPAQTQPALVVTGVPWRTAWKYGERGYRHLWWDAGTMLAQTLALAEEAGLPARLELGFVDDHVARLVGAVAPGELPLAVVALGEGPALPDPPEGGAVTGYLGDALFEFPLISDTHRAGVLTSATDVEQWRSAAASFEGGQATPRSSFSVGPLEKVIRRRGSTRRFDPSRPAPLALLSDALAWAARAVPGDFVASGRTLLEHHVAVLGVQGMQSGAYRFGPEGLHLQRAGHLRSVVAHLCLDQPLGGSGAYTAFHCADLDAVTSALGDRGYRAAQLEAGIVEGRLHLAAFSLGFGASGITFYDDEVRRFFGTTAFPMLVTCVGAPAYRSRPGGTPGEPVRLAPGF
ncbi:MAG: SagB/ThcOx family dehydrogenase [Actinomycetota bacterium]|nr:SagB/ThcOx family dehydrogenase [Actinomycetota bacterium]